MERKKNLMMAIPTLNNPLLTEEVIRLLEREDVVFAGSTSAKAISSARDLIRVYEARSSSQDRHGIQTFGIEELVSSLRSLDGGSEIRVEPFIGSNADAVTAFWVATGKLLGCVAVKR